MKVNIQKLHPDAVIPKYGTSGAVGLDLVATSKSFDEYGNIVYGTGLAIEIPEGYFADLRPRSSISKYDLVLANSVGTIDSDYRGELILKFKPAQLFSEWNNRPFIYDADDNKKIKTYEIGDRIAQLIIQPYPKIQFIEVNKLSTTERGNGGFGSTGEK